MSNRVATGGIITCWENDMLMEPEKIVTDYVIQKFPDAELKFLSGLKHRDMSELRDSLEESKIIVMSPSIFQKEQIQKLISRFSHIIHINKNGSIQKFNIQDFVFLCVNPWEMINEFKNICKNVIDNHNESSLEKLLINCEIHFLNPYSEEHYELKIYTCYEYTTDNYYIIRYK